MRPQPHECLIMNVWAEPNNPRLARKLARATVAAHLGLSDRPWLAKTPAFARGGFHRGFHRGGHRRFRRGGGSYVSRCVCDLGQAAVEVDIKRKPNSGFEAQFVVADPEHRLTI